MISHNSFNVGIMVMLNIILLSGMLVMTMCVMCYCIPKYFMVTPGQSVANNLSDECIQIQILFAKDIFCKYKYE